MPRPCPASTPYRKLYINNRFFPVRVRHNPRISALRLDVHTVTGNIVVVTPQKCSLSSAFAYARERADWIAGQLRDTPPLVPFEDGAVIPFRGEEHLVCHEPHMRGTIHTKPSVNGMPEIRVCGAKEFLARRLEDWLEKKAREELDRQITFHAKRLSVRPGRLLVRDPVTRWGSCSSTRTLSFSWRLIMAPAPVLDYVAAHEVAHLLHMNHSPVFWRTVGKLIPEYQRAEEWLKKDGPQLHRFGP